MLVFTTVQQLTSFLKKQTGQKIGLVPTMGYLHQGHLSLVKKAKKECTLVIVSIFVNPLQFGPQEDLVKYPRNLEQDKKMLNKVKADVLFFPSVQEMYPGKPQKVLADKKITALACGSKRPGHFDGVTTVVYRLFELVKPTAAYFGLKDYQQYLVIKKMVASKKLPINIIGCPIIRERDGVAKSSRNIYLNKQERRQARSLSQTIELAEKLLKKKKLSVFQTKKTLVTLVEKTPLVKIDYIEILNADNLQPLKKYLPQKTVILLAFYVGKTRLIDNKRF